MKPEDKHGDAILRVCSYHRRDFDLVTIRSRPLVTKPVQNSLQAPFESSPAAGLGDLDYLPQELMTIVVKNLDILSYFRFRRVNRYARILATAPREYQLVAKYGLETLNALLRSGCARSPTIVDLYRLLTTNSCSLCGEFGGFLFLLTTTRCCFTCLQTEPKLCVISTTEFARTAGISTAQLSRSYGATLRTVSGSYWMEYCRHSLPHRWEKSRVWRPKKLILKEEAIAALAPRTVFKEDSMSRLSKLYGLRHERFMASTTFSWYDVQTGKIERGVSCKGCQFRVEQSYGSLSDRDRLFSSTEFLFHFASCAEAQKLWEESEEGTILVEGSEFVRSCGYFGDMK